MQCNGQPLLPQYQQQYQYQQKYQPTSSNVNFQQNSIPLLQNTSNIFPPNTYQPITQSFPNTQRNVNRNFPNPLVMPPSQSDESSMDDSDAEPPEAHDWQTVKPTKKRKRNPKSPITNTDTQQVSTSNKFNILLNENDKDNNSSSAVNNNKRPTIPKPPPIFIYGVTDYNKMIRNLTDVTEIETYQCTALQNNTIKINTKDPETYRKLVRHLNSNKIIHHTYQMKEDRAYRVVIRNIHYTVPTEEIINELKKHGHTVRNILNIRHRVTKQPLMMFYVDLEPKENNKQIYDIQYLNNMKIVIEPPHKKRNHNSVYQMSTIWTFEDILYQTLPMRQMWRESYVS